MENKPINCKEVMNHICENLGEQLNSPRCIEIQNHLQNCKVCQSYFKSVDTTIQFYKKYNVNLPGEAHDRLMDFLGLNNIDRK